jgi:hypothetical protein
MPEDSHAVTAGEVFALEQRAADLRLHAEDVEEAARDIGLHEARWLRRAGHAHRDAARIAGDRREGPRPVAHLHEYARHHGALGPHAHEPVGIGVRQRLEQRRVDDREDRRVGADA